MTPINWTLIARRVGIVASCLLIYGIGWGLTVSAWHSMFPNEYVGFAGLMWPLAAPIMAGIWVSRAVLP